MNQQRLTRQEVIVVFAVVIPYSLIHELGHWIALSIVGIPSIVGVTWVPFFALQVQPLVYDISINNAIFTSFAGGGFTCLVTLLIYVKYRYEIILGISIISLVGGITEMIFYTTSYVQEISFIGLVNDNAILYFLIHVIPMFGMLIYSFR